MTKTRPVPAWRIRHSSFGFRISVHGATDEPAREDARPARMSWISVRRTCPVARKLLAFEQCIGQCPGVLQLHFQRRTRLSLYGSRKRVVRASASHRAGGGESG